MIETALRLNSPLPPPTPEAVFSGDAAAVELDRSRVALALFKAAAVRVPAYRDFLRKNGVDADRVETPADLRAVPPTSKMNYLTQYPLPALCWDGKLDDRRLVYTSTSGSTGEPFYFPRDASLDYRSSLVFETYFRSISRGRPVPTLFIVSFGMGVWIGGLISYQSSRLLAERGWPITVITPGANKPEVFKALKNLAPHYPQVVLGGYPPFVKDLLDEAPSQGLDFSKKPLKLLFAAEAFSETFRDRVLRAAGAVDPAFDTGNIYGTADAGTMAVETPLTIALRRQAIVDPALYAALFDEAVRLPTLAQFHPKITSFEAESGELLVTGGSALPLVRYALGDRGGVMGFDEAMRRAENASPAAVAAVRNAVGGSVLPLPFVYVYERTDFSAKLCGAIIFAEHVRVGLQHADLAEALTGKFSMSTKRDAEENEYLEVNVELKPGIQATEEVKLKARDAVAASLRRNSDEYRYLSENLGDRILPKVALWPFEHPEHFRAGLKQRWVKK